MNLLVCYAIFLLTRVTIGSFQHIIPILLALVFGLAIIKFAKNKHKKQQETLLHFLGWFVSLTVLSFHLYKIAKGEYNFTTDLPLYLCSLMGLLIPIFTHYRKFLMYEILIFWIIAGTSQGVITPDIEFGFPSFEYYRYWIVHLGLLVVIFYATVVLKMRPKFKSIFKSFFALQLYIIIIVGVNYLLKANYFYLNEKPKAASLLDYFGDRPWYIVTTQIIIIPYFLLIYAPFYFYNKGKTT